MRKCIALLLMVVVSVFMTHSFVHGAEVIKLKAANYLPVTHPMSLLSGWFCDEVKKRTNGQVEITYHPGGTLLNPVKMYDGVLTGITDLGLSHIQYTRGRFPVMEVFDLPLGFPSGWVDTRVATDFFNKYKPKEWDDVHVLYVSPSGPIILQTISKPVRTLEDVKGIKIRAVGQMADIIQALGGVPVPLQMPDVYDSLRRGVIEGVTVDLSTLKYWKFCRGDKVRDGRLADRNGDHLLLGHKQEEVGCPFAGHSEGIHRGSLRSQRQASSPVGFDGYRGEGLVHEHGWTDDRSFRCRG